MEWAADGRYGRRYGYDVRPGRAPGPGSRQRLHGKKKQLNQLDPGSAFSKNRSTTRDQAGQAPAGPASAAPTGDGPAVKSKRPKDDAADGPVIRPAAPGGAVRPPLIPIVPGAGAADAGRPRGPSDPYKFWSEYYRKHDESAEQLRETLGLLNLSRKFTDVHAALLGYLNQRRSKNREPWMYIALAIAVEELKGNPEDIKLALNYAADAAQRTHNPNDLVLAADKLFLKGYYERIGPLLDEAAAKVPHRSEPLRMSINLAQVTKDPRRMGDSIDRLLSLGWPGSDDYFRLDARKQAEELAARLREEARGKEADELLARLPAALARDLFIRLTWDGDADFDLAIKEPLGAVAQFTMPRTVFGGSILKNGYGNHPEEIYVCPRGFDGDYAVRITTIYTNPEKPPTRLTLETITHEGTAQETKQTHTLVPDDPQGKPVIVHLSGGRRKAVLPFLSPEGIVDSWFVTPLAPRAPSRVKKSGNPRPSRPKRHAMRDPTPRSSQTLGGQEALGLAMTQLGIRQAVTISRRGAKCYNYATISWISTARPGAWLSP